MLIYSDIIYLFVRKEESKVKKEEGWSDNSSLDSDVFEDAHDIEESHNYEESQETIPQVVVNHNSKTEN